MRKYIKYLTVIFLLAGIVCTLLTGCGGNGNGEDNLKYIEKNGIQMENYVTLHIEGYDGYAKLYAELDVERLKEDCSYFLVEEGTELPFFHHDCYTMEDYLDYALFNVDTYDLILCENYKNLSNGDKLTVTVEVPSELSDLLTVDIESSVINYTVKDLEKFEGIDPFEDVECYYSELVSIDGKVGYYLRSKAYMSIMLLDGSSASLSANVEVPEGQAVMLGDTFRVSLDEEEVQRYREKYGNDFFSRTEADIVLDKMWYLPDGEDVDEIFNVMDERCKENVDGSIKDLMDSCTNTETSVEQIGMMFYYDDEGKLEQSGRYKYYNQIVFIYKITNDANPDGWFSYMAYNGYVTIGWRLNEETGEYEKCVGDIEGSPLLRDFRYYQCEHPRMFDGEYPMTFEYNGVQYPGHTDLEDVFTAMEVNMMGIGEYDHLIVTDSLAEYVEEY